ncbi:MAG: multiubiquitin domain-containing protein [Paracoccaceae bacterium]|nr:multiubiquitin domain-containing protein [Candidatus Poribacteria bacterium]MDE2916228.1 multiubiquitin domain-containing protein [Paracoccaceae bacterium]
MQQIEIQLDGVNKPIRSGLVPVTDLYELADCHDKRIFLNCEDGIDIPLVAGEYVLIHGGEKFVVGESAIENNPPLRNEVRPEFNGSRTLALSHAKITGRSLKEKDDKFPGGRLFADIEDGVDVEILDDMMIVVQDKDSYFVIPAAADDDDSIDLEECGKNERKPPKGTKYRIRIDGDKHIVDSATITGAAILRLVGKSFDDWSLNQKLHGGRREKIDAEAEVDLTCPGIERFETVRRQAQQGESALCELLPEDLEYLEANYPSQWRQESEGNGKSGLLIENFPLPDGYTEKKSTLMLLIPSGYPGAALDMFYFSPSLKRSDGSPVSAVAIEEHFGRTWQRWSRHYTWEPGFDSVVKHIEYVNNDLKNEVG